MSQSQATLLGHYRCRHCRCQIVDYDDLFTEVLGDLGDEFLKFDSGVQGEDYGSREDNGYEAESDDEESMEFEGDDNEYEGE